MKLGGNVKGLIVDEKEMDVLYLRKLEGGELKHSFPKVMFNPSHEDEEEKKTFQVPNPTLYAIATDFTSLRLDSSALDRLLLTFGVSALLDHESTALSAVSNAVAALLCEAIKVDVAVVFNSMDFGDGFSAKEELEVASDMKVLLNGLKLVGKVETDSVSKIAKVHIGISLKYLSIWVSLNPLLTQTS
nr:histidine--trna ligase, cytoplasmic [Quercus suber]